MIERNPRALDRVSLVLELPGKMPATKKPVSAAARQRERADDGEGYYSAELTEEPEVLLRELKEAIEG
jgi:hypothetical protein